MKDATLQAMNALAETYETTGIVPILPLGAPQPRRLPEAGPNVGPQAQHADPAVEKAILTAAAQVAASVQRTEEELARAFGGLRPHFDSAPTHEKLQALLTLIQQAHGLCKEVRMAVKDNFQHG